ncbi:tail fiber assembly protein [Aeromonas hydrophila]|nr:tail fiber assembly protein [Aeromonas hydrophila]
MNEPRVVWGVDGFASSSGWETVYTTHPVTNEYLSTQEVWVSVGTGLPASAYLDEPMQPEHGKAIVRDNGAWILVDDYRGQTAYHKQTRQPVEIDTLGSLPVVLTLTPPSSPFDVWNEQIDGWVKDDALEDAWLIQQAQSQRQVLMGEASQEIAVLVDALDPSIISDPSDDDQVKLKAWKTYRVELSKIDQQPNYPDAIIWPSKPQ